MHHGDPPPGPASAGPAGVPVKLQNWALSGDAAEVAKAAGAKVDEALLRRLADLELVQQMAHDGFEGNVYEGWRLMIAQYSLSVTAAWLCTGQAFRMTMSRGLGAVIGEADRRLLRERSQDRDDVAGEVVARTFGPFRERALVGGGWTIDGGASLPTYFMGATVYQIPNSVRTWRRGVNYDRNFPLADETDVEPGRHRGDDPATALVDQESLEELLEQFQPQVAELLRYRALGYQHAEIAEMTGRSTEAVTEAIGRARARIRKMKGI